MSRSTATKQTRLKMFDFCALPGELRNQIYDHLLASPVPVPIQRPFDPKSKVISHTPDTRPKRTHPVHLSLLRVNKAISRETRSYFLRRNTLDFQTPAELADYLAIIGPVGRKCLDSVALHHAAGDLPRNQIDSTGKQALAKALLLLSWCPRLTYFGVVVEDYVPWQRRYVPVPWDGMTNGEWRSSPNRVMDLPGVEEFRRVKGRKGMQVEFVFVKEGQKGGLRVEEEVDDHIRQWSVNAFKFLGWDAFKPAAKYKRMIGFEEAVAAE